MYRSVLRSWVTAIGIASENKFKNRDAAWPKVKDMGETKECEYEEKRARATSPGYVWMSGADQGHEQAEVREDERAERSEQGDKGVTRVAQGVAWTLACMTRSPSFLFTTQASPNT